MPEAIFCESKSLKDIAELLRDIDRNSEQPTLLTRLSHTFFDQLKNKVEKKIDYDPISKTAFYNGTTPKKKSGSVAIVSAGTSDLPVAIEAKRTLTFSGYQSTFFFDVGVSGIHRLLERLDNIKRHQVVIVVAGMDAALASVVGGLVGLPVLGVPTSVGYGASNNGSTALNSMLSSCGQGILVNNIDNGFGGACGAIRILNMINTSS